MSDAERAVAIDTRPCNVRITGPDATPEQALALLREALAVLRDAGVEGRLESGGVGFSAERSAEW